MGAGRLPFPAFPTGGILADRTPWGRVTLIDSKSSYKFSLGIAGVEVL